MDPVTFFSIWAIIALEVTLDILIVVLAILRWRPLRVHYRTGLLVGAVSAVLVIPEFVYTMVLVDWEGAAEAKHMGPGGDTALFVGRGLVMGFLLLASIPWRMLIYHVALTQWLAVRRNVFLWFRRRRAIPWRGIGLGAAFGAVAALISTGVFRALDVGVNPLLMGEKGLPLNSEPGGLPLAVVTLGIVSSAAIVEELVFRGGLQAVLTRLLGSRPQGVAVVFVAVSGVWAAMHLINTDSPMVKFAQIFLIGLVFCYLAHRVAIEASIAGHLSLNAVVVALELLS